MKVDLSCPIELWAFELPTSENPACSFTFFNLDKRLLSSIQITVTCFDDKDEMLARSVERPMALEAKGRDTFMVTLASGVVGTEWIDLSIDKVWFTDGSAWRRAQEARLVEYEPNELPPNRRLEQLRYIAGPDAVGYPSDQENIWICVCGRVNGMDEESCKRCMRDQRVVFSKFTPEAIEQAIEKRERQLEDKARFAREEASRKEFLRQDKVRKKKRHVRMRTAAITITLVIAGASYLFVVLGMPEYNYQTAVSALNTGAYTKARAAFDKLSNYRDAADLIIVCDMRIAQEKMTSGNEAQINEALLILEELAEYPDAQEMHTEATYQKGVFLLDNGRYDDASALFETLGTYKNASEQQRKAEYAIAEAVFFAKEYEDAQQRYVALGNYLDAASKAKLCTYNTAVELMIQNKYDEASELFKTIIGFKDANEQYKKSVYNSAMTALNDEDYEKAIEKFILLERYEDAGEQHKYSVYKLAQEKQKAGDLDTALKLFLTIPGYESADENSKICAYTLGNDKMKAEAYEEALPYLNQAVGYKNANDLIKQCYLLPAEDAINTENFKAAITLLENIKDEPGIDKRLLAVQYSYADQLEKNAEFDAAKAQFAALGDYQDAGERTSGVDYAIAQKAFEEKDFETAKALFTALGDFSDAETRVKECEFEQILAMDLLDSWEIISILLEGIDDYPPAHEKSLELAYQAGDVKEKEGDLYGAYYAFEYADTYQDAQERMQNIVYMLAVQLMEEEDYPQAAAMFNSIPNYLDARGLRDECYIKWLYDKGTRSQKAFEEGKYEEVLEILSDINIDELPSIYNMLKTYYYESNMRIARALINEDRALEAYPYLLKAKSQQKAKDMLNKNIYKILGTWETSLGVRYSFYLSGTCDLAGQEYLFNMPGAYPIMVGKTEDDMVRMFSFSSGGDKTLRLRIDETGEMLNLTRVKQAEFSPTEDGEGVMSIEVLDDSEQPTDALPDEVLGDDAIGDEALGDVVSAMPSEAPSAAPTS